MSQYEILNKEKHRRVRIKTGYGAALGDSVMYAMTYPMEFRDIQSCYPILFTKDPNTGGFFAAAMLGALAEPAHAQFGEVFHINCHSMNSIAGRMGEGGEGTERADFVLGDRDRTTCDPAFTEFVRQALVSMGYAVKVNDPYKGVELVRAYSDPARGRHSLQVEINKRLYMDEERCVPNAGYATLQRNLFTLVEAVRDFIRKR